MPSMTSLSGRGADNFPGRQPGSRLLRINDLAHYATRHALPICRFGAVSADCTRMHSELRTN